jgi:DNA-directed RNA polymerase subunit RPC12/RpoP
MKTSIIYSGVPFPGNGFYICRNCGNRFLNKRSRILSELIGDLLVRCPKCKSLRTQRTLSARVKLDIN